MTSGLDGILNSFAAASNAGNVDDLEAKIERLTAANNELRLSIKADEKIQRCAEMALSVEERAYHVQDAELATAIMELDMCNSQLEMAKLDAELAHRNYEKRLSLEISSASKLERLRQLGGRTREVLAERALRVPSDPIAELRARFTALETELASCMEQEEQAELEVSALSTELDLLRGGPGVQQRPEGSDSERDCQELDAQLGSLGETGSGPPRVAAMRMRYARQFAMLDVPLPKPGSMGNSSRQPFSYETLGN